MRKACNFKNIGRFSIAKIFKLVQLMWPEALWTDNEQRPGLYIDVVDREECKHFTIWETAGSILDSQNEAFYNNGVLEFRIFDDHLVVSSYPRQDAVVDAIMMSFMAYFGWEPYHTSEGT